VEYIKTKPSADELRKIVAILEDPVADLVRKDSVFEKLGLKAEDYTTPEAVVEILAKHPRLMQRPVVVANGKAIIGRPKDRIRALLSE
jgi:arsenate reductase (glutaredoxin)